MHPNSIATFARLLARYDPRHSTSYMAARRVQPQGFAVGDLHGVLGDSALAWLLVDEQRHIVAAHVEPGLAHDVVEPRVGHSVVEAFPSHPQLATSIGGLLARGGGKETVKTDGRIVDLAVEPRGSDSSAALVLMADVTAHAHEDEASRERDRENRVLFRQFPGALWTTDRNLRITDFYGDVRRVVGIDEDRIVGTELQTIVGSRDPSERCIARHLAALAGKPSSFRYPFKNRWYEVHLEPRRNAAGEIVGCVGAALDVTRRKEADDRLKAGRMLLRDSQRLAHVGSWVWDIEHDRVSWTEEMYRIYGIEPIAFAGTFEAFLDKVHPDEVESTKAVLFEALRCATRFEYDHRIVRPDGTIRMLHTVGNVITANDGARIRMTGACSDVTEAWESKRHLERTVSLLEATLESTADGTLVVDLEGHVTAFNQRFLALWRIPSTVVASSDDEALIRFVFDQLCDPEEFLRTVRSLYERRNDESFDTLRFRDGRVFERYSRPQRVEGEVVGRVWSFRDVTERERLLGRALFLSDASRLLTSLDIETALEGVACLAVPLLGDACVFDLLGNGAPRRLLAIARQGETELPTEIPTPVLAGHSLIRAEGNLSQISVPLMARDTVIGTLTLIAAPHHQYTQTDLDLAEELGRRSAISIENSRLYRATQEAVQAREEFLSIAAHEIRGPLSSMRLAIQSLRREQRDPEKLIDVIERDERRLARFVDELLDLGRLRTGGVRFVVEPVSLGQVVRDAASGLAAELTRSGSSLSIRVDQDVVGSWDKSRLTQVVSNLLSNAIRFGLGKPIEIVVTASHGTASIAVTDHGIGIPPEKLGRIFEPFERAVPPRHYGGLGLGLYIARTIVQSLGGSLDVRSAPGEGSTFTVDLPIKGES